MNAKRSFLFRAGAIVILLLIAGAMLIVGRGHTVYFDNKAFTHNGQTYAAPYKITVNVDGEQAGKLYDKERGKAICIGQKFVMDLEIMETQNGAEETKTITLRLPYDMDGIILNLPALLAGLPQEAYLAEFTAVEQAPAEEEEIITEDFGLSGD